MSSDAAARMVLEFEEQFTVSVLPVGRRALPVDKNKTAVETFLNEKAGTLLFLTSFQKHLTSMSAQWKHGIVACCDEGPAFCLLVRKQYARISFFDSHPPFLQTAVWSSRAAA